MSDYDDANPTGTTNRPAVNAAAQALTIIATLGLVLGAVIWGAAAVAGQNGSMYDTAPAIWMVIGGQLVGVGMLFLMGTLVVSAVRHRA